jgi:putative flavoprotein involved in K+ transport
MMLALTADQELNRWLTAFDSALSRRDVEAAMRLFLPDAYWRDLVAFTWNVLTAQGHKTIRDMLEACLARTAPNAWQVAAPVRLNEDVIEATTTFETAVAHCRAVIRLKDGKCWTLLTEATELKGFEETCGARRPHGAPHRYYLGRKNWQRQREHDAQDLGTKRQPYCVIVGAGHCGLSLAARLKQLDVPTMVIDKRKRPSDTWRERHDSLSLHSPSWFDRMPCLSYPDTWPLYPSKDQFADWLEVYATLLDLDVWPDTECLEADFDEARAEWQLQVRRGGRAIELHPKQLVFATGLHGTPKLPEIAGMQTFRGEQRHASSSGGNDSYAGRNCLVVGSGTSAHDICAELWEAGAHVTMIQRSPTIVIRQERLTAVFAELYGDEAQARGITAEVADLLFASVPQRVLLQMQQQLVAQIKEQDAPFYERLREAGFQLTFGEEDAGILPQIFRDPSGYYVDVGASELIADGSIKLKSGVGVKALREHSVILTDGSELPADVIVYATGYEHGAILRVLPQGMARRVGQLWGLGSGYRNDPGPWEGELRNMWKPTRQPGLWFASHGIAGARFYSRILALQIKARQLDMSTPVYWSPARGTAFAPFA